MDKLIEFLNSGGASKLLLGVAIGVLTSLFMELLKLPLDKLLFRRKLKIGSNVVDLDMGDIEGSIKKLDTKIRDMQDHPQVFLSHSYADKEFATQLANDLKLQDINVWLPEERLRPGDKILDKVQEGIEESQWVCVILSPSLEESKWVNKELLFALNSEKSRNRSFIIPILYKGTDIPKMFQDKLYADFRSNYEAGLEKLVQSLKRTSSNVRA